MPPADPDRTAKELKDLPANTWVERPTPKRPQPNMDWGSAVFAPELDVIVRFSGGHSAYSGTAPQVYDVKTDCAHPVKLGTVEFPGNVHNIEMDPSGTHVYASMPLQQADITNLADPSTWAVRNFQCDIGAQVEPALYPRAGAVDLSQAPCDAWPKGVVAGPSQISHEFEFNGSGTRMYIGDQNPYPFEQALHLVDMSVWPPRKHSEEHRLSRGEWNSSHQNPPARSMSP